MHYIRLSHHYNRNIQVIAAINTSLGFINQNHQKVMTNESCMPEGTACRLNRGYACYYLVQYVLSFCLLSNGMHIKVQRAVILNYLFFWVLAQSKVILRWRFGITYPFQGSSYPRPLKLGRIVPKRQFQTCVTTQKIRFNFNRGGSPRSRNVMLTVV